jgi:plasmid stabilization system protein ParE
VTKVVYTAAAERDLTQIGDAIADDDPHSAIAFVESLRRHCSLLSILPHIGRSRPDVDPDIRSFAHGHHIVFYTHRADLACTFILRVWSGRRRMPGRSDPPVIDVLLPMCRLNAPRALCTAFRSFCAPELLGLRSRIMLRCMDFESRGVASRQCTECAPTRRCNARTESADRKAFPIFHRRAAPLYRPGQSVRRLPLRAFSTGCRLRAPPLHSQWSDT